jgi:hypothetical protein
MDMEQYEKLCNVYDDDYRKPYNVYNDDHSILNDGWH